MLIHNIVCINLSLASAAVIIWGIVQCRCLFEMKENSTVKHGLHIYLFSKYVELFDTVFMVLRQKQRQITFLHVSFQEFPSSFMYWSVPVVLNQGPREL